jgi:hypothetical protein
MNGVNILCPQARRLRVLRLGIEQRNDVQSADCTSELVVSDLNFLIRQLAEIENWKYSCGARGTRRRDER